MDVQQQRVEFVIAAKRGAQPFCALCERIWDYSSDRLSVAAPV
jgi:hypothetical protein